MKYVFMVHGEEGTDHRASGNEFLSGVHEFPEFKKDDEAMTAAFWTWVCSMEERANKEHAEIYGPETTVFLELYYSDLFSRMTPSQLEEYAEIFFC